MLYISIILLIISLIISNKNKSNLLLFSFCVFLFISISNLFIVANYYTGNGIDESVIYLWTYGAEGAGVGSDIGIMIVGILGIIFSILVPFSIYRYLKNNEKRNRIKNFIAVCFLIFSFAINPFTKNILELNGIFINYNSNANSDITFKDLYKIPEIQKANQENKNIIFIYLESYENLYLNQELFPKLATGLNNIKNNSLYFDNINQAYGASRTIAGMVGSQCGIPLINSGGGGNSMYGIERFLPGAFCLGDFLNKAGYNLNYMGGAKSEFAGKGNFYLTHGFNSIEGQDELITKIDNKDYVNFWGLYDDDLFNLAYKKYEDLSSKEEKFGLFMISLDTHGDKGFVSKECINNNINYTNDEKLSVLNSYKCDDYLVSNFVEKIQNNPNFKNTLIVIASDHYAMSNNNAIDIIKQKEEDRRILFMVIDPEKKAIINKMGTTLDIGPTVLSLMGFKVDNLGLGVNLLSENKTIQEQDKNFIFKKWKTDYESFWSYPTIKQGFKIDKQNKNLLLDNQKIKFPALILFDENIEINKILWEDLDNGPLIEEIPKKTNSIFVNKCETNKNVCIIYTNKSGKKYYKEVDDGEIITSENIINMFGNK